MEHNCYLVLHYMISKCEELLLPLLNEMFDRDYKGFEKIEQISTEPYLNLFMNGIRNKKKTILCTAFSVDEAHNYLLTCWSTQQDDILLGIVGCDLRMTQGETGNARESVSFEYPGTGILILRQRSDSSNNMKYAVESSDKRAVYMLPCCNFQENFSVKQIINKKLLFFIPFYVFKYEKNFAIYEENILQAYDLENDCVAIDFYLKRLLENKEITTTEFEILGTVTNAIMLFLTKNYRRIRMDTRIWVLWSLYQEDVLRIANEIFQEEKAQFLEEGLDAEVAEGCFKKEIFPNILEGLLLGELKGCYRGEIEVLCDCVNLGFLSEEAVSERMHMSRADFDEKINDRKGV